MLLLQIRLAWLVAQKWLSPATTRGWLICPLMVSLSLYFQRMLWGKRLNELWHLWKISCSVNHVSIKPCTTSLRAAEPQCTWPVQYKVPLSVWWTSHLPNPKYKLLHPNMSMFSRSSWMILRISLWLDHDSLKWLLFAGYPDPEVVWLFDEAPLQKNGRFQMNYDQNGTCTLTLAQVQPGDSGIYKCCASNSLGQALCSARLTVQL